MVKLNIVELLKKNNKSKYWLRQNMNITSRNLNKIIRGETTSISFKYIEDFCKYLNCTPGELFNLNVDEKDMYCSEKELNR
ncbi:MAG: helix-turn-helix transcriptional regulator [Bacilli bacterium]|nr:helix-turn-helix transcriptional regulator [Bacilli bacterium]